AEILQPVHPDMVRTRELYAEVLDRLGRAEEAAELRTAVGQLRQQHEHLQPATGPRRLVLQAGTPVAAALLCAAPHLYRPPRSPGRGGGRVPPLPPRGGRWPRPGPFPFRVRPGRPRRLPVAVARSPAGRQGPAPVNGRTPGGRLVARARVRPRSSSANSLCP